MTREENLKKIKDACVKANPEIMELKLGCNAGYKGFPIKYVGRNFAGNNIFYMQFGCQTKVLDLMEVEILGRDIQLADVLLAVTNTRFASFLEVWVNTNIELLLRGIGDSAYWNLLKPLHDQPAQTLEFIVNLLKI